MTSPPEYQALLERAKHPSLMEWVTERHKNCERIATKKSGADRAGWLEDATYFRAILSILEIWQEPHNYWRNRREQSSASQAECGCIIGTRNWIHHVQFCPLHRAAPDLLAALTSIIEDGDGIAARERARAAIARAAK